MDDRVRSGQSLARDRRARSLFRAWFLQPLAVTPMRNEGARWDEMRYGGRYGSSGRY